MLQQGKTFEYAILSEFVRAGRVDILQLAHAMHAPITADMIDSGNWEVVIWACRHGVPVNCERLEQLVRQSSRFDFPEQKSELLSLLRCVRKRPLSVLADAKVAGGDDSRAQKRRK